MGRYVFKLPDVGEGTAEAELVAWHVKVGDTVAEDQIVADVMTDKATVELTSPVAGVVTALHGEPGQMMAVRGPLAEFEVEGEGNAAAEEPAAAPVAAAPEPAPVAIEAPKAEAAAAPVAAAAANHVFKLPDVGEGTAEAELVGWHVKVGDAVQEDQILAEVMTDKATVELTSPVSGVVVALHGEAGQQIAVGGPLVSFKVEGKGNVAEAPTAAPAPAAKAEKAASSPVAAPAAKPAAAPKADAKPVPALTGRQPGERPLASPAVRNRARDLGIDLVFVPGSGPAGRIEHADLDAFVARGGTIAPAAASGGSLYAKAEGTNEVRIIGLRRKIAEKMAESVRRIPHITYVEDIDMTAVEELRAHLNAQNKGTGRAKLNVLPFIARAIVVALKDQPNINATYDDEAGVLTQHNAVHLGIAAQTPNGLMVPVVRHAEARDAYDTAEEIARVSGAAKDGSAKREELSGSTITITSLGTLGGVVHTPIINHPEVAIVGPNKIEERVVVRNGQMVVRKMMNLSSSFDHRIVDGHDAAVFVQKIKTLLENPATLWMN
ncbi:Lipoamide acyltransferase component of branched-chain alpha-keto acid dehydrogenase complex [Brevundimonas diminuta]|uniref:2-oxo acid dehydrogenase subunit E2 n=1 Tax=Brevundimonas diminuta TaxID=293 RepID=UPI000B4E3CE6|nr:2-oxo acid dehydrogenase subunit E2 [Brevundimonas diminuta]OWR21185.1 pyruvate dehydrogenase [Brevundimonas diminuta]WQE45429.1 2-oxo acid dehydrogenase subunit E2 [Brevundimonas diminuta]SPU44691.1 Lipoamide acyltransferase component of branched-chain alpha-keto acid dehydrogenase complex [Brevundimonas diminuta]SUW14642.1 Lipoamide acyltransferase component of branched-chain alpha-keto acid dehydrogenase complex [Brevundimonas diminuta]